MRKIVSGQAPRKSENVLAALAAALLPYLKAELAPAQTPSDDRVDLATVPPGKRRTYAAARDGEIDGARKIGRRWYAPRASYEQWLEMIAVRPEVKAEDAPVDDLDAMRERLGLRRVG